MISAGASTCASFGWSAVDLDAGQVAGDDRERDQRRRRRADRHHRRPLALAERLQRLARRLVALLGLGVAARHRVGAAVLALAPPRPLSRLGARCAQPPGATPRQGAGWSSSASWLLGRRPRPSTKARRSSAAAAPGSAASRIARTTQSRRAPAATTCSALPGSMPPIAEEGLGRVLGGVGDELQPDRRPPRFRRRLPDRADADVVDRPLVGRGDLLLGVGREADDRVGPEQLARRLGRGVVLADVDAVGVAGAGQVGIVVDDEEGAVGVADAAEGRGGALDLRPAQLLLAQLHDVDAAAQRRAQQRFGVLAAGPRVADEVEARGAQPLAAQRPGGLWGREAHPPIMNLSRRPPAWRPAPRRVASRCNGSPRGLRGWHEATDRLNLIRVMPAEAMA